MSLSLFKLDKESKVILHPEAIQLCPELSVLSQDETLFVILLTDYNSIFSQFTEDERFRRSSLHVWGDYLLDVINKPKVKNAIQAYKSLQYSPKIEQIRVYQNKINLLLYELSSLSSAVNIKSNMDATKLLRSAIHELEQEVLESYQEENRLVGGGKRSFLEKIQANKSYYESVIKKK